MTVPNSLGRLPSFATGTVITLIAVIAPACSSTPPRTSASSDSAARSLTRLDDDWSKAAATRNAKLVAAFYADDAIAYPPNAPACQGRAAAEKAWAAYFVEPTFTISWKTLHAQVSESGELGFTSGSFEDSFKGPDGKLVSEKGKYLCVWKKQKDGSWKAIHDMWNSDSK